MLQYIDIDGKMDNISTADVPAISDKEVFFSVNYFVFAD